MTRAGEVLHKAYSGFFPNSGLQVRMVDESGLPFNEANPLPIDFEAGGVFSDHNQLTFSGNVTQIVAADTSRRGVLINASGNDVFVGSGTNVSTNNGYLVEKGSKLTLPVTTAVHGVTAGSSATVYFVEVL